jgi:hypothetical protein
LNSPWNSTTSVSAHHRVRITAIDSSVRAPRRSHGMFIASASSWSQPAPTP